MTRAKRKLAPYAKRFDGSLIEGFRRGRCKRCGVPRQLPVSLGGIVMPCGACQDEEVDRHNSLISQGHGASHFNPHKLNYQKAQEIRLRLAAGESNVALADEYGVTPATICNIKKGRTWA